MIAAPWALVLSWWTALDPNSHAAIIGSVFLLANGLVSAYIARLGVGLSARTSREISEASLRTAQQLKQMELSQSARTKIAEARIDWIDSFRRSAAELYGLLSQISRTRRQRDTLGKEQYDKSIQELYAASSKLKSMMLMSLDVESDLQSEKDLEKLLRKALPHDYADASRYRREIRKCVRLVLKAEWERVKSEIEQQ